MYQQHPPPMQNQGYGMPQQQYPPPDQFGQGSPPQAASYSNALVPSTQPSNPYAIVVAPPQHNMHHQSASNGMPVSPYSQQTPPNPYGGSPQQQPYDQQNRGYGQENHPASHQPPPVSTPPPATRPVHSVDIVPAASSGYPGAPPPPAPATEENQTPAGSAARNKYSAELAQHAPMGASPLPRADMVQKTGYVLSRISFRTIVMKKWKQSFWVQYGPHTMLWFRSQADFEDWLNNPYHTQAQRNFLIKLAVNFAHDLYKPNVRGYQVTQCRTKSYGTKLIRQFKLERWMDYGPTIAAAFGSNNPKEVDDLREALVACMRNTPLNGGIRATGAVRERADTGAPADERGSTSMSPEGGYDSASYAGHQNMGRQVSRSVASANELGMDHKGFDEGINNAAGGAPPPPTGDLLDFSEPVQQQPPPQQQQGHWNAPPQQAYYGHNAMQHGQYPVQNYPGQQMPTQQQNFGPPPVQQQAYGGY
ncbi:expressed unknown protein [Seminavis robusta]|uniref:Uncharacterized protein n=1 Tax=Seminavis robusta TaxID=568900 RepID=A0A9N8DQA0_9STRA|nr:expressed unknown protein [Seminavis robusta]|eukprot:Sro182_g079260.1 n/a (477) ;mRNA; r:14674-16273